MNAQDLTGRDPELVYRVAQLFVEQRALTEHEARQNSGRLADYLAEKVRNEFPKERITREMVWPLAAEAARRGFLILLPPPHRQLQEQLTVKYPHLAQRLHVVKSAGPHDNRKVAYAAARIALEHSKQLVSRKKNDKTLGLGLGPGRATRDFCECFGKLIAGERDALKLDLFAISAGCPAKEPEYASISFFNLFDDLIVSERTGLFAETLVYPKDLGEIKKRAGVREAFRDRAKIDLVVTSMGDMEDEHDLLRRFLEDSGVDTKSLLKSGWVGNVQYRPYSAQGPIEERSSQLRAVTLFELDDLVEMSSRDDKKVILIARRCGRCSRSRANALKPLLAEKSKLRVFSDLVMDSATCEELLATC